MWAMPGQYYRADEAEIGYQYDDDEDIVRNTFEQVAI